MMGTAIVETNNKITKTLVSILIIIYMITIINTFHTFIYKKRLLPCPCDDIGTINIFTPHTSFSTNNQLLLRILA